MVCGDLLVTPADWCWSVCNSRRAAHGFSACKAPCIVCEVHFLFVLVQRVIKNAAGIFEGNVVHYEASQLEGLATKFCSEAVGTLLDGGSSAYHGAMTTDWALKGAESSTLQELIRYAGCHSCCSF